MKVFFTRYRVNELIKNVEGSLSLYKDVILDNASELHEAIDSSLCFYENPKYLDKLTNLQAGLVIVRNDFDRHLLPEHNLFFAERPYLTFNGIVSQWLLSEQKNDFNGVHPSASIGSQCSLGTDLVIKENVIIGNRVKIGSNTVIESNTVIGDNVGIGDNCRLKANVTIYNDTIIKDRVVIHSGTIIGADGFGYIFSENKQQKIHHIGNVIIDDDVEIGANTCIDRGTVGATKIGQGTKIDNLVQVGHNCIIGRHSIICAQVGLSGHTEIGDYVYLAGQVGSAGHLKVEDGAMVGAQSGISGNIPAGKKYFGTPAIEAGLQKRIIVSLKKLPEILRFHNKHNKSDNE